MWICGVFFPFASLYIFLHCIHLPFYCPISLISFCSNSSQSVWIFPVLNNLVLRQTFPAPYEKSFSRTFMKTLKSTRPTSVPHTTPEWPFCSVRINIVLLFSASYFLIRYFCPLKVPQLWNELWLSFSLKGFRDVPCQKSFGHRLYELNHP